MLSSLMRYAGAARTPRPVRYHVEVEVTHREREGRFEAEVEGHTAVLAYRRRGGTIVFTHTEVPEAIEGRGVGSALAKAGLEYARAENAKIAPLCAFVKHYVDEHPEYRDMVTEAW